MRVFVTLFICSVLLSSCRGDQKPIEVSAKNYHQTVDKITDIMVHDIFSPPVASRIYAYSNLAAYQIMRQENKELVDFSAEFEKLEPIPKADSTRHINFKVAALVAQMEIGKKLIFSEDMLTSYRDSLYASWKKINQEEFVSSKKYGLEVARHLSKWMDKDNYKETRTMPKYTVYSDDPGRWQPTPPSYMDGIEPHWEKIRPFTLDSASQFKPAPHPEFSLTEGTTFHNELMEVYEIKKQMEETGDKAEEVKIAQFWDCNPYVSTQRGHLMFATKKITPGGHWMGICKIAAKKADLNFSQSSYAYTATAIALADGFISCWEEKYSSNLVRPETLINKYVDDNWKPVLQTPPFPEYSSGHSVVSGAASIVLTKLFGNNFSFKDDTEVKYGLPIRTFNSFSHAASEAAVSRLYGGIHYRSAVENGLVQGKNIGNHVVRNLNLQPLSY
ncbi:PAP2 superfamily protein [Salegentibacter sp. 24]|uniref:vanadium-dependent haloperoxidase n=1 Tax=Salegentibacter sp. 24 TaxID=2183986 RepID=UPI00105F0340|nr:vanadium-dependent haloperoxidase [Salegentibacter sp. 24]TDN83050.1 PAP2 superfamily protein [Salegentibacter sp. 24]